jgi:hypothetical protein
MKVKRSKKPLMAAVSVEQEKERRPPIVAQTSFKKLRKPSNLKHNSIDREHFEEQKIISTAHHLKVSNKKKMRDLLSAMSMEKHQMENEVIFMTQEQKPIGIANVAQNSPNFKHMNKSFDNHKQKSILKRKARDISINALIRVNRKE